MYLGFGEVMLRLAPAGRLRLRQSLPGRLDATFAGAEANVCVSLAMFGQKTKMLTALPKNSVSDALVGVLRGLGVDTSAIVYRDTGRVGTYFVETGANQRGSSVLYDRDASAISLAAPEEYDLGEALDGVHWVHITGITPGLSEKAFHSTLALVREAAHRKIKISCDLNFRSRLWRWKPGVLSRQLAGECMSRILPYAYLVIANEEDTADVLGLHAEGSQVEQGRINAHGYEDVARGLARRFADVAYIAVTLRESHSADHNNWGGMLYSREDDRAQFAPLDAKAEYQPYEIRNIVDRVGAGDAFSAGLIYALNSPEFGDPSLALRFAVAAGCLKHAIRGDFNFVTEEEVAALVEGNASGRVRR